MAPYPGDDGDDEDAYHDNEITVPREHLLSHGNVSVNQKLTTMCPRLDGWLRAGVPTRSVTELVGEAGSAKTQLVLQLLLSVQLPYEFGGLDGKAVYVHTERRAPIGRLKQLVDEHPMIKKFQLERKAKKQPPHDFLKNVTLVSTLTDPDGLWTALASVASLLDKSGVKSEPGNTKDRVRVLIVDSISSPFREGDASKKKGAVDRAHQLSRIAALLREYAHRHDIAVVVTNHVVDTVESPKGREILVNPNNTLKQRNIFGPSGDLSSSGRKVTPALGFFWSNCINTRIFLKRSGGSAGGFGGGEGVGGGGIVGGFRRSASVVFSSHLPNSKDVEEGGGAMGFEVRGDGVFGLTE